ncbi:MAG: hypothetical protein ABJA64_01795, partial [Candidatus Saccharibacteria bacterium]
MKKTILILTFLTAVISATVISSNSYAQPYGKGLYNENVPYGGQTALSIATNGNVSIPITP